MVLMAMVDRMKAGAFSKVNLELRKSKIVPDIASRNDVKRLSKFGVA
jgi:hypothetical protein